LELALRAMAADPTLQSLPLPVDLIVSGSADAALLAGSRDDRAAPCPTTIWLSAHQPD
jgi:hypothetical protein